MKLTFAAVALLTGVAVAAPARIEPRQQDDEVIRVLVTESFAGLTGIANVPLDGGKKSGGELLLNSDLVVQGSRIKASFAILVDDVQGVTCTFSNAINEIPATINAQAQIDMDFNNQSSASIDITNAEFECFTQASRRTSA